MLNELAKNTHDFTRIKQFKSHLNKTLSYFAGKLNNKQNILDIGERNPLTNLLEKSYNVLIDNTNGDLDLDFQIPDKQYDVVIYSHTIEHQFNPLYTLFRIREVLKPDGLLYILLPERGKLLWCKGHFHEIDEYRMQLLLKRAGFRVVSKIKQKIWRNWWEYIKGFRPILRLFFEYHAVYCARKEDSL